MTAADVPPPPPPDDVPDLSTGEELPEAPSTDAELETDLEPPYEIEPEASEAQLEPPYEADPETVADAQLEPPYEPDPGPDHPEPIDDADDEVAGQVVEMAEPPVLERTLERPFQPIDPIEAPGPIETPGTTEPDSDLGSPRPDPGPDHPEPVEDADDDVAGQVVEMAGPPVSEADAPHDPNVGDQEPNVPDSQQESTPPEDSEPDDDDPAAGETDEVWHTEQEHDRHLDAQERDVDRQDRAEGREAAAKKDAADRAELSRVGERIEAQHERMGADADAMREDDPDSVQVLDNAIADRQAAVEARAQQLDDRVAGQEKRAAFDKALDDVDREMAEQDAERNASEQRWADEDASAAEGGPDVRDAAERAKAAERWAEEDKGRDEVAQRRSSEMERREAQDQQWAEEDEAWKAVADTSDQIDAARNFDGLIDSLTTVADNLPDGLPYGDQLGLAGNAAAVFLDRFRRFL